MKRSCFCLAAAATLTTVCHAADDAWPVVCRDNFEHGMGRWETTDPEPANPFWRISEAPGHDGKATHVLRVTGMSNYQPRFRSPQSIAWLKGFQPGDFQMTARVQSTSLAAGPHRDMCLFWGRQDADHYYYVHLGAQSDPNACQIFIVNGAPRTPITVKTAKGTPWTDAWHHVKVVRRVESGDVEVYFDDMATPLMTANDRTFAAGQVGLGSFDDHGNWDDFELRAPARAPAQDGRETPVSRKQ